MAARGDSISKQGVLIRAKKRHAHACVQSGRLEEAAQMYQSICGLQPEDADAWFSLGTVYGRLNNAAGAEACLRKALEVRTDFPLAHANLGQALERQGRFDEAAASLHAALSLKPDLVEAQLGLARIALLRGHIHEAVTYCAQSMEQHQGKSSRLLHLSHFIHQNHHLTASQRAELHVELGRRQDRAGHYDLAFAHFQAANRLLPRPPPIDELRDRVARILQVYSVQAMARAPRAVNCNERPVFIVGLPSAGVDLAERMLARHPAIAAAGPMRAIASLAGELALEHASGHEGVPDVTSLARRQCDVMAQSYLDRINAVSAEALRITDASWDNFFYLGLISLLFPMARIIHCTREVRDSALSCYFGYQDGDFAYGRDLQQFGIYYGLYQHLMQQWRRVMEISVLELSYEELVQAPAESAHKMVAYCGLKWDDACAGEMPLLADAGIGRWKNYESRLAPLSAALTAG